MISSKPQISIASQQCMSTQSLSHVWLFATLWSVVHQGSPVHRILQARILEWVAISFSRASSWARDWICISCIGRLICYHWVTWEAQQCVGTILGVGHTTAQKETPEFFERTGINIIDNKHKNKVCMMSDVRGKTGYRWGWEQVVILNRVVSLNLIEKVLFWVKA